MTKTPINSIKIPRKFVAICNGWYSGSGDMLYAVSSTGNLTTGTINPYDSDEKWYLSLWDSLSADAGSARLAAESMCDDGEDYAHDADILGKFEEWVDVVCERLAVEYGLEDWHRE